MFKIQGCVHLNVTSSLMLTDLILMFLFLKICHFLWDICALEQTYILGIKRDRKDCERKINFINIFSGSYCLGGGLFICKHDRILEDHLSWDVRFLAEIFHRQRMPTCRHSIFGIYCRRKNLLANSTSIVRLRHGTPKRQCYQKQQQQPSCSSFTHLNEKNEQKRKYEKPQLF